MAHVIEFAGYTFPGNRLTFSPSFGGIVQHAGRLPGLDGGFDEYGGGQAPNEIGNISMSFTLIAASRDEMQEMRDEVLALAQKGKQELRWKPDGFTEFRFCNARISNISIPQTPSAQTDFWQSVSINFQVTDPRWYSYPFEVWYFDGTVPLDGSHNLGGWDDIASFTLTPGVPETLTIDGSADTFPRIIITADGDDYITPLFLQRLDENDTVQDEIELIPNLVNIAADEIVPGVTNLTIDCRKYSVIWHTVGLTPYDEKEDWIANINAKRAEFFRLAPGANKLKVVATNLPFGIDLAVKFEYLEAWR